MNRFPRDKLGDVLPPIFVSFSAKPIAIRILGVAKLNGRWGLVLRGYVYDMILPSKQLPVQS